MNLKNLSEVAGDLATFAIHNLEGSTSFQSLATQLAEHQPDLVPDVKEAQAAIDDYLGWLKENRRIFSRFEKTAKNFSGFLILLSSFSICASKSSYVCVSVMYP